MPLKITLKNNLIIARKSNIQKEEVKMTEIYMEYNPYSVELKIQKDGKRITQGKLGSKLSGNKYRLQALLGKGANWKGLIEEIVSYCNDDEVDILFKGRTIVSAL